MIKWNHYSRTVGYVKNSEMLKDLKKHKYRLDEALAMVGVRLFASSQQPVRFQLLSLMSGRRLQLAQALEQTSWNKVFSDAQQEDHRLLEDVDHKQDEIIEIMRDIQQAGFSPLSLVPSPSAI